VGSYRNRRSETSNLTQATQYVGLFYYNEMKYSEDFVRRSERCSRENIESGMSHAALILVAIDFCHTEHFSYVETNSSVLSVNSLLFKLFY
jgi:hypothetical protein